MSDRRDRLYELLPAVYRQLDAGQGQQLRDYLRVIAEQVNVVEDDITRLYDNWFAETCEEWVVPYIGDLIGYEPVHSGPFVDADPERQRRRNRILAPRRELANTIRNRASRGTIWLLELLARDTAGLPARAVEFFQLLLYAQGLNHLRPDRGRTVDLRDGDALDRIGGAFDTLAHTVDIRRATSAGTQGRYNIPSAGAFIWRLRPFPVTHGVAYADQHSDVHYTFSALGNNAPIFVEPRREPDPTTIAGELEVPAPIRRRDLDRRPAQYYPGSFTIWKDDPETPLPLAQIVAADLSDWYYTPPAGKVAVDPVLGRIAFPDDEAPEIGVWVSYRYGFSSEIGGGEYRRSIAQADGALLYRVGARESFRKLDEALWQWRGDAPPRAVIEIADSETYVEPMDVELGARQYLQIRGANGARPVIRLVDWQSRAPEAARIKMAAGARFVLDGVVLAGRPLQIHAARRGQDDVRVAIRDCTLVPGWLIFDRCPRQADGNPSLELEHIRGRVTIDRSILGLIKTDARGSGGVLGLEIRDSIIDGLDDDAAAISGTRRSYAGVRAQIIRCTVIGEVLIESLALAENSIFTGELTVVRRQHGCVRYCYVPHGSRTPRRYQCQPDLAERSLREETAAPSDDELAIARERVKPRFDSLEYGRPDYCRLSLDCPDEITRGADDESEMGVFHDVFAPQRHDNLRTRLTEHTPSSMDTGIFYAD